MFKIFTNKEEEHHEEEEEEEIDENGYRLSG